MNASKEKSPIKSDKLDTIFVCQQKLDSFLAEKRGLNFTPSEWIQKETLAIISELGELLDEVRFKWWKNPLPIDETKVKEELVDVLHFFVGMCLNAGMTADELFKMYLDKNEENFKRQFGTSLKEGYKLESKR